MSNCTTNLTPDVHGKPSCSAQPPCIFDCALLWHLTTDKLGIVTSGTSKKEERYRALKRSTARMFRVNINLVLWVHLSWVQHKNHRTSTVIESGLNRDKGFDSALERYVA